MTPSGEQDLSREGLGFFLAMVRSGDEKAVEVLVEEFDRLHRVIETVTEELEEYRSIAERIGAEKAVSLLVDTQQQLATMTAERDEWQVKARWKHTHDDSLECELATQLAASQARCAEMEEALKNIVRESQAVADDHHRPRYSRLDESLLSARQALTPTESRQQAEGMQP